MVFIVTFSNRLFIKTPSKSLQAINNRYHLENEKIGHQLIVDLIKVACKKTIMTAPSPKVLSQRTTKQEINKIKKITDTYFNYKKINVSAEDSFNAMFSNKYIQELIFCMEHNEDILFLYISPIFQQLIDKELGGSNIDNKSWASFYNQEGRQRKYKENITKLKEGITEYKNKLVLFESTFNSFNTGYKVLKKILIKKELLL